MSEDNNTRVENGYKARNKNRINKLFDSDIEMFPAEFRMLYYDAEAEDDDIRIELDAIGYLHAHRLEASDEHKLTYCSHKTRLEMLNKLLANQLRSRAIIIDISEPWKSDVLAKFIRGETDYDKSKMGIVKQTNNDASGDTEG